MYTATRSTRYDPTRHCLRNVRITAQAQAAERRRRCIRWLIIIGISVAILLALAATDTGAACITYTSAARVTNVSRIWYAPGLYEIAGYTYGRPKWLFVARTRLTLRPGHTVIVSGCQSTERQLAKATVRLP